MSLTPGTRLGSYEILARLGAGGMGEVYRAKDTRLDREVAIKVLPEAFAQDPERLARFEREAKVLAALNHPNIAQIFGLEEWNGVRALVMELVPGGNLAQSLHGPPLETALPYAQQIAEALEAAHEKGIVHRDLKPANIMITPAAAVKVLDFGLAAVGGGSSGDSDDAGNSPTLTLAATRAGTIMGTAAYMSPEQAAGKRVDKRSDIWSFGVVLFEMLTGKRLFGGETASHTLADVLRAPIDFDKLPQETPASIRGLLRRCLDRNVRDRLRDIGEARVTIHDAITSAGKEPETPAAGPSRLAFGTVASVVAGVAVLVAAWGWLRPGAEVPAAQSFALTIVPAKGTELPPAGSPPGVPRLSPDGAWVLTGRLLRNLNSLPMEPLRGIVGVGGDPFWSSDSKWVAFPVESELRKMRVPDGAPELIARLAGPTRGAPDGTILMAYPRMGLQLLPAAGGEPKPVTIPGLKDGNYYIRSSCREARSFSLRFAP